jgi:hypothetical protein
VNDAQYGRIIPTWMHNLISRAEDKDWNDWRATHSHLKGAALKKALLAEAKLLEEKYHTNWLFHPAHNYTHYRGRMTRLLEAEVKKNRGYFRPPVP